VQWIAFKLLTQKFKVIIKAECSSTSPQKHAIDLLISRFNHHNPPRGFDINLPSGLYKSLLFFPFRIMSQQFELEMIPENFTWNSTPAPLSWFCRQSTANRVVSSTALTLLRRVSGYCMRVCDYSIGIWLLHTNVWRLPEFVTTARKFVTTVWGSVTPVPEFVTTVWRFANPVPEFVTTMWGFATLVPEFVTTVWGFVTLVPEFVTTMWGFWLPEFLTTVWGLVTLVPEFVTTV
jgi:hypothetical protein